MPDMSSTFLGVELQTWFERAPRGESAIAG